MDYLNILFRSTLVAIQVPIFLLLWPWKKQAQSFLWLAGLLIYSFTCDFLAELLYGYGINPNYSATAYTTFAPVFYAFFFYYTIGRKSLRRALLISTGLVVTFSIVNFVLIQKSTINSNSLAVDSLFVLSLCVTYFYSLLRELPEERIHRTPSFWAVSGILFMASTKMILFSFAHFLINVYKDNLLLLAYTNLLINLLFHTIIAYAAWLQLKKINRHAAM